MEAKYNTHLYFIRDRLSHTPESAVIQSLNDATAVRGFQAFLQSDHLSREQNKMPQIAPLERELVHICALDENNHVLVEEGFTDNSYRIVCNGEEVDNYLEEIHKGLRGDTDEEGIQN